MDKIIICKRMLSVTSWDQIQGRMYIQCKVIWERTLLTKENNYKQGKLKEIGIKSAWPFKLKKKFDNFLNFIYFMINYLKI